MNTKYISVIALSLGLVFGATACTSNEPEPNPTNNTSSTENRAEAGKIDASTEKLPLSDEVSLDNNNYLITTTEETKFTIEDYGKVEQLPTGEKPAEGEVFHAIHYSNTHPRNANVSRPVISYVIDGQEVPDMTNSFDGGTKIISAPEDAKISVVVTTTDSKTDESIIQQIDFKTGTRLSEGVLDAWYVPNEGTIAPNQVTAPIDPERTATITMNFTNATKNAYEKEYGWADSGRAWLILETDGVEWNAGNNVALKETAEIWLTDENNNVYDPIEPWGNLGSSELVFSIPAGGTQFTIHTLHSGVIDKEGTTVKEVKDVDISNITITFDGPFTA